jgi:hypothetical protein
MAETAATVRNVDPVALPSLLFGERASGQCPKALWWIFPDLRLRRTDALTVVTGGILGVLVSISSVGAGAIGMIALIILYPQLSTPRIVGSDIAHAVPLTLIAGAGHLDPRLRRYSHSRLAADGFHPRYSRRQLDDNSCP